MSQPADSRAMCQAPGFVEAGLSGAGGYRLGLFLAVLADVGDPGGFVLDGGTHTDSGVRANGARTSAPTRRWRARRRRCPPKGPGYGSARPCTRSSEPRPGQSQKESPVDPTEVIASHSDRAAPWRMDLYCTPRSQVMHQAREISPSDVSAARRPSPGRPGQGRCTLADRWSASR